MTAGLFGKLPSKRDFIAVRAPRRFLEVWEPWLQAGLAASRQSLGADWTAIYNCAPIWRFWLGPDLAGEAFLGAFMPSVDGVGRSFPLTIFSGATSGPAPSPDIDANDAWCSAAEGVLLGALEIDAEFDAVAAAAAALPRPSEIAQEEAEFPIEACIGGGLLARDFGESAAAGFARALRFAQRRRSAASSFWWTVGGDGYPPLAFTTGGMPRPDRFADMLTGAFAGSMATAQEALHGG